MYNSSYIEDFNENYYLKYLPNIDAKTPEEIKNIELLLKDLADSYINQYIKPTYLETLAFKESLDHYVLKQLKTDPNFKNSSRFKLYCKYIRYIMVQRQTKEGLYLECSTNVLMNDSETRKLILSQLSEKEQNAIYHSARLNSQYLKTIAERLSANDKLTQQELDLLGDYLYTRKNTNTQLYSNYIKYLISEVPKYSEIQDSPQMVAAYLAYHPHFYGNGCENSRIFYTNGYSNQTQYFIPSEINKVIRNELNKPLQERSVMPNHAYSSGRNKCISMGADFIKLNIHSDESLQKSRQFENKDLYWISMISFHELTHQYQQIQKRSKTYNSSGFAYLVADGLKRKKYKEEHDNYEIEIDADETAWDRMVDFVRTYQTDVDKKIKQIKKCQNNKKAVYGRRTFITKLNSTNPEDYYKEDLRQMEENMKEMKKNGNFTAVRNAFPMIQMLYTEDAEFRPQILLEKNITSKDEGCTDPHIMGCELADYILCEKYEELKEYISTNHITEHQSLHLLMNIYNSYHLKKTYLQALSEVEKDTKRKQEENTNQDDKNTDIYNGQYSQTKHHFDLTKVREKYLEKFKNIADLVYKEQEIADILQSRYPSYSLENFTHNGKYASWNYEDAFNYLYDSSKGVIYDTEISDVIARYNSSNNQVLKTLAKQTQQSIQSTSQAGYGNQSSK